VSLGHGQTLIEMLFRLAPRSGTDHHRQSRLEQVVAPNDRIAAALHLAHPAVIEATRIKPLSHSPPFFHVRSMSESRDVAPCVSRLMHDEFQHDDEVMTRGGQGVPEITASIHCGDSTHYPDAVTTTKHTPRLAIVTRPLV
jgi:hypothetical protein